MKPRPSNRSRCRWLPLLALLACMPVMAQDTRRAHDSMAERTQACTACHGAQGRATSDGWYPRIAGKPAGYLYNQLLNFRDGRRRNATMAYLLQNLPNDYLREIAEHFSALD